MSIGEIIVNEEDWSEKLAPHVVIAANDKTRFSKTADMLTDNGFPCEVISTTQELIKKAGARRGTIVYVSWNLENANVPGLIKSLAHGLKLDCIAFAENEDAKTRAELASCRIKSKIQAPFSDKNFLLGVKSMVAERKKDYEALLRKQKVHEKMKAAQESNTLEVTDTGDFDVTEEHSAPSSQGEKQVVESLSVKDSGVTQEMAKSTGGSGPTRGPLVQEGVTVDSSAQLHKGEASRIGVEIQKGDQRSTVTQLQKGDQKGAETQLRKGARQKAAVQINQGVQSGSKGTIEKNKKLDSATLDVLELASAVGSDVVIDKGEANQPKGSSENQTKLKIVKHQNIDEEGETAQRKEAPDNHHGKATTQAKIKPLEEELLTVSNNIEEDSHKGSVPAQGDEPQSWISPSLAWILIIAIAVASAALLGALYLVLFRGYNMYAEFLKII